MWSSQCLPPGPSVQGLRVHKYLLKEAKMRALVPGTACARSKCCQGLWGMEGGVQSSPLPPRMRKPRPGETQFLATPVQITQCSLGCPISLGEKVLGGQWAASLFLEPGTLAIPRAPACVGPSSPSSGS